MREWALDLHIHTLLSPCADNSMLPATVIGRAKELGIEIMAITDHNTAENVASFLEKGREMGVKIIPGMELQTSEDVHLVCLFNNLEQVGAYQEIVYQKLPPLKNKRDIFGEQWIVDKNGDKISELDRLLLVGTGISVDEAVQLVHELDGLCIASHIDRQAFSLWGHLGSLPPNLPLDGVELTAHLPRNAVQLEQIRQDGFAYVVSSDAHYPDSINPPQCFAYMQEVSLKELKLALKNQAGRFIRTLR
jgi:PHP family Zn ribbon phosphoesterase